MVNKMKMMTALLGFVFVSSCGPLVELPGSGDAPKHFELEAPINFPTTLEIRNFSLYVEEVSASGALRSDAIMVKTGANKVEYLSGAIWADRTPRLIRRHITETLENAGKFQVFGNDSIDIPSDYRLRIDVREFGTNGDSNKARVRLSVMMLRSTPLEIISQRQIVTDVLYSGTTAEDVVTALNKAMDEASLDILSWVSHQN